MVALMDSADEGVWGFLPLLWECWPRIAWPNCLEWLGKAIKCRARMAYIFPDNVVIRRVVGAVLLEQSNGWRMWR